MAYTNPQQWLDLLRRRPGTRFTDLGPAGQILDATGPFLNRQGANPRRDWRSMMAEGEARRQSAPGYGTPSAIRGASLPGARQPVGRSLSTAETVAQTLGRIPGSSVSGAGVRPMTGGPGGLSPEAQQAWQQQLANQETSTNPAGFIDKVGGFFNRPGMAELLLSAGGAMSQAASQPGSSFLGSLGAGTQAGVAQLNERRAQEAVRDRTAASAPLDADGRALLAERLVGMYGQDLTPEARNSLISMARLSQDGLDIVTERLSPTGKSDTTPTALVETEALSALAGEVAELEAIPVDQRTPEQAAELAAKSQRLTYMERATDTDDPVPPTPPAPSTVEKDLEFMARAQGFNSAADAQTAWKDQGLGDWMRIHMAQIKGTSQPDQYRGRTPSRGQIAAETRRIEQYDDWFLSGRGAQFEKNLDTFNEVMFDLDQRIAAQQLEGSSDWDNDGGSGFAQALRGAMVQRMPFMAAAQVAGDANTLDLVRAVVFQSLKETLGGQFAEREADNLVRAAYNPMLPPEVNRRRIQRLMTELRTTDHYMESMADYYQTTGELAFYTHRNAEEAWDLAVQTGDVVGLGSTIINPLEYGGLEGDSLQEAMDYDLQNLTPEQRSRLGLQLLGGTVSYQSDEQLQQELAPMAYQMLMAIRRMGR